MSQKLTDTTIVVNPATMTAEVLLGGSVLPSWAEGLVGDHLLTGQPRVTVTVSESDPAAVAAAVTAQLAKATKAQLKAYAEEQGIDLGSASKVDEIRAVITAAEAAAAEAAKAPAEAERVPAPDAGDGAEDEDETGAGDGESDDESDAAGADED